MPPGGGAVQASTFIMVRDENDAGYYAFLSKSSDSSGIYASEYKHTLDTDGYVAVSNGTLTVDIVGMFPSLDQVMGYSNTFPVLVVY